VQRLIASTSGDSARDIRDHAILILLATYGFRSGEVAGLRLENVNWGKGSGFDRTSQTAAISAIPARQ